MSINPEHQRLAPEHQFVHYTAEQYEYRYGRPPEHDDLERINCDCAGDPGHRQCGWCVECNGPRMFCHSCSSRSFRNTARRLVSKEDFEEQCSIADEILEEILLEERGS